ncbi:GTPase HflX [bacterium 1xD8-6]|nr:GTPase HflX [bacterium D16-36]RKI66677.1 GTPase HflX [bacterium 1xD8-6]
MKIRREAVLADELYDTAQREERIILAAVAVTGEDDTWESLDELEELGQTAGAVTVAKVVQNRDRVHSGTYLGKGKIQEIKELITSSNADCVVCDDELTPAQYHNLQEMLDVKVIDRTVMILDIFAGRASTSEGKLQVELAQLRYRASHLIGERSELSRLGGGIGTRGPGEQKLEMDRRLIKERITFVKRELAKVQRNRELTRKKRLENPVPVIAIVGYTNAGKSTLLNNLTGAGVLSEDKLFATLDPTTRRLEMENGEEMLFTDTVGFIRKLPHHLIQAFRSTLEEAKYADVILHVVDCSNSDMDMQMQTVYDTLQKLEVGDKPILTAFNKIDLVSQEQPLKDLHADKTVRISAKQNTGIEEMLGLLSDMLKENKMLLEEVFPYEEGGRAALLRKYGQILEEEYRNDGIFIRAYLDREYRYLFERKAE